MSKPATPTTIEDLPPEMIGELFKYLHLKDLVACSLVNKRWNSIYAAFKLHRLAVIDDQYEDDYHKWFNSNRPIQKAEWCCPTMFLRWTEKPLLSNLKQLLLYTHKFEFDLNKLNRFRQLVHLEISVISSGEVKVNLNLSELKVLALHSWNDHHPLSIDCPLLNTLLYDGEVGLGGVSLFEVKQPETIKKLDIGRSGPQLAPFKGVECLVTKKWTAISKATLLSLPRLRELRYNENIEEIIGDELLYNGVGTVDRVKRKLNEFLDDIKDLRGSDFRFTFSGFKLTKTMLNQINFCLQADEEILHEWVRKECVYMKNYQLIEPGALDFISEVDYSLLLSCVTREFPRCFFQKFTGIERVQVNAKVQDPDHFLWFLKSIRSLRSLGLQDTGLGQEFYDQLPVTARSLAKLYLRGEHCENELNFDFIGKLPLSHLRINQVLPFQSFSSLVRWLGGLELCFLGVRLREENFIIEKVRGSVQWKVKRADQLAFETENANDIINFFDGLHG